MDVDGFLEVLGQDPDYEEQMAWRRVTAARRASYGKLAKPLPDDLTRALEANGVHRLYRHQVKAIDALRSGKNIIVATGAASGKSLCYNLPVAERLLGDPKASALYLFPTKALAQDQLRAILAWGLPVRAATYDGDTPSGERSWIRANCNLVLSNPDMLHTGILPHHGRWPDFFLNLRYVVVDEVHTLRGVFGSNVAQVLRRLRRVCAARGNRPRFVLSSATVANPEELAGRLTGLPFEVIEDDSCPRGKKVFVGWNPAWADETRSRRKSPNSETERLLARLVKGGTRTIAFSKSRKAAELVSSYAKKSLRGDGLADRIAAYRAGYLARERRTLEARLFRGELTGVSATNALELGIDIGTLEACLINGFPGTVASVWQQAGRAGRREAASLAVLIGHEDPLDQYYLAHPESLFGKPHEEAIVDLTNTQILAKHLRCAAFESPLTEEDEAYFGADFEAVCRRLAAVGELRARVGRGGRKRWFPRAGAFPAGSVGLRSTAAGEFSVVEKSTGTLVATVEEGRVPTEMHPGAIYLHQGEPYVVEEVNTPDRVALVERSEGDYYTETRELSDITILSEERSQPLGPAAVSFGAAQVTDRVIGFMRKSVSTGKVISSEDLEMPPHVFATEAYWFDVPESVIIALGLDDKELAGGIHAIEHAAIGLLPVYAICDRWDVGGVSTPYHEQTQQATIFIYDGVEGGIGIAERGYARAREHLMSTLECITECTCSEGCPSCIQSPKCGNYNDPLDKKAAAAILSNILGQRGRAAGVDGRHRGRAAGMDR